MRRLCVFVGMLLIASLLPKAASAGPITIDPIIGVRGGMFGSVPIDTSAPQSIGQSCHSDSFPNSSQLSDLPADYLCLPYQITEEFASTGILSVDLSFTSGPVGEGTPILASALTPYSDDHMTRQSDFTGFEVVNDFTVRIFGGAGPSSQILCQNPITPTVSSSHPATISYHPCSVGEDVMIYIGPDVVGDYTLPLPPDLHVALTNVNAVPEPASLLLIGTGIATLAGRRLRRKNS